MTGVNDNGKPSPEPIAVSGQSIVDLHLDTPVVASTRPVRRRPIPRPGSAPPSSLVEQSDLQLQLDWAWQELLFARDAAIGAETEAGVLRAKLTEKDAQLRARERELEQLAEILAAKIEDEESIDPEEQSEVEATDCSEPNDPDLSVPQQRGLARSVAHQVKVGVVKWINEG